MAANDLPVCSDLTLETAEDTPGEVEIACSDADGDQLTASIVSQGGNGTATVVAGPTLRYSANANASGADSFSYRVSDAGGSSNTASVAVTIEPPAPADGNLVGNGGYESSVAGWGTWQASAAKVAGGSAGASAARVSFSGEGSGYAFASRPPPVGSTVAGSVYEASAQARSETPGRNLCLVLQETDADGRRLGRGASCLTATGAWQGFDPIRYTTTGSGGSLHLHLEQGGAPPGDSFDLDEVRLIQQGS